jgi:hypothetical protein
MPEGLGLTANEHEWTQIMELLNQSVSENSRPFAVETSFCPPKEFLACRKPASFNVVMSTKRLPLLAIGISRAFLLCLGLGGLLVASCDRPTASDSAAPPASASANDAAFAGVVFRADPNPVPPGEGKGRTTIIWDTGSDIVGEVYVVTGGNEKLFGSGRLGSQEAPWIQPGSNEFRLYAQADHKLLAQLTVTMPAPPANR